MSVFLFIVIFIKFKTNILIIAQDARTLAQQLTHIELVSVFLFGRIIFNDVFF
jgi:hypothetical protein